MKLLIWTRSEQDWEQDQKILRAVPKSIHIVHWPCLRFTSLPVVSEKSIWDLVVFTSPRGVQEVFSREEWSWLKSSSCEFIGVGSGTGDALRSYGVSSSIPDVSGAEELFKSIVNHYPPQKVFLPGPRVRAFDGEAYLTEHDFRCERADFYETTPCSPTILLDEAFEFVSKYQSVMLFASPSAVTGCLQWLGSEVELFTPLLRFLAIGRTTLGSIPEAFSSEMVHKSRLEGLVERAVEILDV